MNLFKYTEDPNHYYVNLGEKTSKVDNNFKLILEKMKLYEFKQTIQIKGSTYQMGDFYIKLGVLKRKMECLMVEIEYAPIFIVNQVELILKEFSEILFKDLVEYEFLGPKISYDESLQKQSYSLLHTSVQYLSFFSKLSF